LRLIATQVPGQIWRVPYRVASPEFAMSNRAAKFVSAIFASVLAGASLATLQPGATRADDCLSAPKDETPEGSHWYYRIEHATKRHCWYLRQEGEPQTQTAAPDPSPSANPMPPRAQGATPRSLADAHAELPARTSIAPEKNSAAPLATMPAAMANDGAAPAALPPQSVFASRWPETSGVAAAAGPQPVTTELAANLPSTAAAAPAPAAAAAVPLAAADTSQGQPASVPKLLAVMTGALALAGITATVVFKLGGARRPSRRRARPDHLWERADHDSMRRSNRPAPDVVPRRTGFPRDLDQPADADLNDASERIAEFISQLSRRAPT
jgi:hypothetical protein